MQLISADADFGAQAVFEAVGKAGRGIDHHRTGINFPQEPARQSVIFSHYRFGMAGTVLINVLQRLIDAINNPDR